MADFSKVKISNADSRLISKIANRANDEGIIRAHSDLVMDLELTHGQACPLDLQDLLDAATGEFLHDINGIVQYLNRDTGKMTDCFLPRFSADPQSSQETVNEEKENYANKPDRSSCLRAVVQTSRRRNPKLNRMQH